MIEFDSVVAARAIFGGFTHGHDRSTVPHNHSLSTFLRTSTAAAAQRSVQHLEKGESESESESESRTRRR